MDPEKLRKCFKMTLNALDRTLEFIMDNNLREPSRIDYITYLTGYFVYKRNDLLTSEEEANLMDWYSRANFVNKSNKLRREMFKELLEI